LRPPILGTLSQIFNAAIDNGIVAANPTRARSIKSPPVPKKKVIPWTIDMVDAAAAELDARHKSGAMAYLGAGAGLRESEIFGIAEEDIEFLGVSRKIHVQRQVKRIDGKLVFAPPKGGKDREVPLSDTLSLHLSAQIQSRTPVEVTLPWRTVDRRPHTVRLLFVKADGLAWYRQSFEYTWNKVREAAGAPATKENGMHVLRHTAASARLAGGVDIRTLAEWLGHGDPGFTLRTYTHLMPNAAERGRKAMDDFLASSGHTFTSPSALKVPSGRSR
jgi:integrase